MLRIKLERLRLGWNQVTLAYHAGMSVGDVSRIECGRLRPYNSQINKLSAALGIAPALLLDDVPGVDQELPNDCPVR